MIGPQHLETVDLITHILGSGATSQAQESFGKGYTRFRRSAIMIRRSAGAKEKLSGPAGGILLHEPCDTTTSAMGIAPTDEKLTSGQASLVNCCLRYVGFDVCPYGLYRAESARSFDCVGGTSPLGSDAFT